MMLSTQKQAVALGTVVLLALSLAATAGVASAAETDSLTFEPAFEEEQVLATDNQTLSFTVTNKEDEPFDFPIIEIVDSAQIDINETSAVVIDEDGNENNRGTDTLTERESVSGEDVVIIEGEGNEIPPGETVTFEIKVDVLTAGDVEIESLVYPIQNEPADISEVESRDDSVIDTVTTEAFQPGTLNVNVVDESDVGIVVNGNSASTGSYSEEVAAAGVGGESVEYDVGAEIPLADDEVVTLDGVTVPRLLHLGRLSSSLRKRLHSRQLSLKRIRLTFKGLMIRFDRVLLKNHLKKNSILISSLMVDKLRLELMIHLHLIHSTA